MQFLQVAAVLGGIFFLTTTSYSQSVKTCHRDIKLEKMQSLEMIKQDILLRLGFEEKPTNPSNASDIPIRFLKEYETVQIMQELDRQHKPCAIMNFNTQEVKPIFPIEVKKLKPSFRAALVSNNCIRNNVSEFYSTYRIKFQVDLNDKEFISSAQLRLRKFHLQLTNNSQEIETVQRVPKDVVDVRLITRLENYYNESRYIHITMESLDNDDIGGLAIFNMTKAVVLLLESSPSESNIGELEVAIQHRCPQSLTPSKIFIPNFQFFENSDNDGLLVLTIHKKKNLTENRNKRQDTSNDFVFCREGQAECCMKRLTINFERDFNWTWVLRPKEVAFNYCQGGCPIKWGFSNEHANFLDILRSRTQHNPTAAPEPCCVPNSFSDIALLLNVRGMYLMRSLNDILATSCSCR